MEYGEKGFLCLVLSISSLPTQNVGDGSMEDTSDGVLVQLPLNG